MNELGFRFWLIGQGIKPKVVGDIISRLKRIEREIDNCDIDEEYRNDGCKYLLNLFLKMGNNDNMGKHTNTSFPIGKYYMNTYRYAIKQYIRFSDDTILSNQ